jgi:protein HOOK3
MSESEQEDPRVIAVCEFFSKVFFSVTNPPEDLSDLCDGVVMFEALAEISMDHFDPTTIARDLGSNWALKATNLKKLLRNLEEFYHEELQKDSDFESISTHINDIAKGDDVEHIVAFVELIAVAATTCEDKEVFVNRLREMDPESLGELQEILQDGYRVITDFDVDNAGEDDDADSLVFEGEEGGDMGPTSPSTSLFPSHEGAALVKERDELRQALQDAKRELGQAKSQSVIDGEDNQKEKSKLRALNEDLQERLARRDEELMTAEQGNSRNKRSLEEAQTEVVDLREKSASLADELDVEKSKVLQLRKSEAMVEVYRKKLDALQSTNQGMEDQTAQTAKYVEQIMTLESENKKLPTLQKDLDESKSQGKMLESRIAEAEDARNAKDAEILKLKNAASSAERAKKMYEDELNELRAQHEGAADAALALNGASESNEKTMRLEIENKKLRDQMEKLQVGGAGAAVVSSAAVPAGDMDRVAQLEKLLTDKDTEVAKLVTDKEKLEAYTKKTLQKFQEKYLVALQDCKAKLKEKHDKIEALEQRGATEKVAQRREEKLMSSAIFELGMGIMSNKLGKR